MVRNVVFFGTIGAIAVICFLLRAVRPSAPPPPVGIARPSLETFASVPIDITVHPIVDDSERDNGPKRIISMAPSITQTCFALGLGDHLVGRTQYCKHPPAAETIPIVGALVDANLELIVQLKPDLVLVTTTSATQLTDKLLNLHLPVEKIPDSSLDDVFWAFKIIGRLTDRPKSAAAAVERLHAELTRLSACVPRRTPRPSVLIVTGPLPIPPATVWVAGPGSYLDQMVRLAGCRNALAEMDRPWGEASLESIVLANPDYILEARDNVTSNLLQQLYATWGRLGPIRAIHQGRVRSVEALDLLVPSPRVNITLHRLIQLLAS